MSKDNPPRGVRHGAIQYGPDTLPQSNATFPQFAGKATIAQNSDGVTVPCTIIASDSYVFLSAMDDTVAASGNNLALQVRSIVPGTSFDIVTCDTSPVPQSGGLGVAWKVYHKG